MNYIDLRSDTVTRPTDEMRKAMAEAIVGDDVFDDDPTIKELELLGASLVGKEAAIFIPSGTMGNQLALFTHCPRGTEVILPDTAHIVQHEAGASSIIAGVQLRTVDSNGTAFSSLDPQVFAQKIRKEDSIHEPKTSLICLENACSDGTILPLNIMQEIRQIATRKQIPIHLDGARIFNAATTLGVDAKEIAMHADTVMFCLSKGLCAPVGSLLAGSKTFIEQARAKRKIMGGAMRQVGVLAAAGLIALNTMRLRLHQDHENAKLLATELSKIEEIDVNPKKTQINMVFFRFKENKFEPAALTEFLKEKEILCIDADAEHIIRFVCHNDVKSEHIPKIVKAVKDFLK